jgi:uncharacterized protein YndB with AHSA1/START domain
MTLPYRLDRTITIQAPRELVFGFFTDSARWAAWWGEGSTIAPRPGGAVYIRHPGNVEVRGEIVSLEEPASLIFTYGYVSGQPFPVGASRVTIALSASAGGTRLQLTHEFPDAASRDIHVQGWRYQLSVFSNSVLDLLHRDAESRVDAWFGLWSEMDAATRSRTLSSIASDSIAFRDRYSAVDGVEDVSAHIGAAQRLMALSLRRRGPVRHCQGTVVAEWDAVAQDGTARGTGLNVFGFGADGRITVATGFWG